VEIILETVVRCTEIDVNGHVNNGKYVEYLEWGREEWYDRHGFTYDRLKRAGSVSDGKSLPVADASGSLSGAITVVVNINLNLRKPCHQGDRLQIVTWPERRGRTSFVLGQRIQKEDGAVAADALVTLVMVDPTTGRSRTLPEEFAALFPAPA